jgi:hypothetical protein
VIRSVIHAMLVILGFIPWAIAITLMAVTTGLALLADRARPHARAGNCWSYALQKWAKHDGYLIVRAADGQRFLGLFPVPHVAWVRHLGDENEMRFFVPERRKTARWVPWYVVYYSGRILTRERSHDGGMDSSQPAE